MRRWTLARRVTALVALGALGMVVSIVVLLVTTQRNDAAVHDLLGRVVPARRDAAALVITLLEEQNAVRGYALTGDPAHRAAYQAAADTQARAVAGLRAGLPADDPNLVGAVDAVDRAVQTWQARGAAPLVDAVTNTGARPSSDPTYRMEEELFAPVLTAARALLADLDARRETATEGLAVYRRVELVALGCGAALATAAAVGTLLLLRRWVTRPIERLADDARLVAEGAHDHRVRVPPGPPELTTVAAAVERMRSRIVSELAELEASQRELQGTQEQLREQAVDLMRSNRDLEQFAYVASHDLQEPLRKVSGFCQLLRRRYAGQLDERAQQYIEFAVDGAQRMQQLINDLLAFSRVGRSERPLTEVSLTTITRAAVDELASNGAEGGDGAEDQDGLAGARIEVGELPVVRGDPVLLRQLMTNLLGNAIKFHRPDVPPEILVDVTRTELGWEISVADNGIGVDPEYAEKIFVIFQRLHGRGNYPGTGIGLALAKRIVEYHGGRIWLDTARRDGATVRFTLPFPPPDASQEPAHD
jgi:signal transduction histidine kinase